MKRRLAISLGALAFAAAIPFVGNSPVLANLQDAGASIAQAILQPKVKLVLGAEKQIIETDEKGEEKVTWQALKGAVTVQPGDVLRYTVSSENAGDRPAKNLVVTQPVPTQTTYIVETANGNSDARLTYSIDNGETFVAEPMIEVTLPDGTVELQPAPAEAYTHVRWDYGDSLEPLAAVKAVYEVAVE
ncbi:MAG: DUF11 domain-containing protein [Cyanothece sp. SIO1E1]|nr:DUF11 domain-containing protein [Cyanothece sp. SIO1E1]